MNGFDNLGFQKGEINLEKKNDTAHSQPSEVSVVKFKYEFYNFSSKYDKKITVMQQT